MPKSITQNEFDTGRLWTYVRDDRPSGDGTPAAVWFAYSPDRKGEHPRAHLSNFTGTLQADGYAGFDQIYEVGRIQEAACWAHVRRKFYDLEVALKGQWFYLRPTTSSWLREPNYTASIRLAIRNKPRCKKSNIERSKYTETGPRHQGDCDDACRRQQLPS
jgi:hypothetical protein